MKLTRRMRSEIADKADTYSHDGSEAWRSFGILLFKMLSDDDMDTFSINEALDDFIYCAHSVKEIIENPNTEEKLDEVTRG